MLLNGKMGKALGLIFCSTNREISRNYVILFLSLYVENFKKNTCRLLFFIGGGIPS